MAGNNAKTKEDGRSSFMSSVHLQHFCAGAVAGTVADTMMHPFDTINTRLKVQQSVQKSAGFNIMGVAKSVVKHEGVTGLFGGLSATLLCALPSTAIYFGVYEAVKRTGCRYVDEDMESLVYFTAGATSELAASVIVVPFEVVKSRMQLGSNPRLFTGGAIAAVDNYSSAIQGLRKIKQAEGFGGLYAGYRPCVLLDCCYSALQFVVYERIQKQLSKTFPVNSDQEWNSYRGQTQSRLLGNISRQEAEIVFDLTAGGLSGGLAAFLTNPIDVVTNRMMVQAFMEQDRQIYEGAVDCCLKIIRHEGFNAFWSGATARVVSVVPLSAITFGVYERMKRFLQPKSENV